MPALQRSGKDRRVETDPGDQRDQHEVDSRRAGHQASAPRQAQDPNDQGHRAETVDLADRSAQQADPGRGGRLGGVVTFGRRLGCEARDDDLHRRLGHTEHAQEPQKRDEKGVVDAVELASHRHVGGQEEASRQRVGDGHQRAVANVGRAQQAPVPRRPGRAAVDAHPASLASSATRAPTPTPTPISSSMKA